MSEGRSGEKEKARGFFSQSMETAKRGEDEEAEAGRGDAAQERGANLRGTTKQADEARITHQIIEDNE